MSGLLTLVATPIGNLEDISERATRALREADLIYAEDTRHSGRLLVHLGIEASLRSCHDHNEEGRSEEICRHLDEGKNVALVSDAGTPGLADPGFRVVRRAVAAGHTVTMIPGASSILMALVLSGLPTDRFVFEGWLPRRSGRLRRQIEGYAGEERSLVLLESNHRLVKSLAVFAEVLPDRPMVVCRELTKRHEEIRRGSAEQLLRWYEAHPPKGELVVVVAGEGYAGAPS
jgi:16S rRNA (cytidine1402-2'-O)-methyltransferase